MNISPLSQYSTDIYFSYPFNATQSYVCSLSLLEEKLTEDRPSYHLHNNWEMNNSLEWSRRTNGYKSNKYSDYYYTPCINL